jgi:uncharacterized protein YlxP (DUF503 family)
MIGILTLHLHIPGCKSLKEKRSRLKPLLARLHREFNISVAEMDANDVWQSAVIACAVVSNDKAQAQRTLQTVSAWVEQNWQDMTIVDEEFEIIG